MFKMLENDQFEGGSAPMLKVELRSLEQEEVIVQERDLARALGLDLAPELSPEPLEIFCQLSKFEDLISAKGWVKGKMLLTCDRCLEKFESGYKSFFELHYRPQADEAEQKDDEEAYPDGAVETVYFEGDILDIADQIRQTVLLSVPMRALCREDCRGLCGNCGCNLNVDSCQCSGPSMDSRWSKLKNWKPQ
jgi:uncharacterized protein